MTEGIAKQWLADIVRTVQQRDHTDHMNLISKNVSVAGVPGFANLGYQDWSKQTEHEFKQGVITEILYRGFKMRAATDTRIMFVTHESISADDGSQHARGIECLLEKETDGQWRLLHQRVLGDEETQSYLPESSSH